MIGEYAIRALAVSKGRTQQKEQPSHVIPPSRLATEDLYMLCHPAPQWTCLAGRHLEQSGKCRGPRDRSTKAREYPVYRIVLSVSARFPENVEILEKRGVLPTRS